MPSDPTSRGNNETKDAPNVLHTVLQEILVTLQKSSIAYREVADTRLQFWNTYKTEAEEYDIEFLRKYNGDLDICLIFSGLFSAVSATFIVMMQPDLVPDPNMVTQVLLQLVIYSLNTTASPLSAPPVLPEWTGPSITVVWVQSLLYASLACSLISALGAVLGKQWLNHYSSIGERGTIETRGKDRQRKLAGLEAWHLRAALELLPFLLQISLLLFGVGLCAYLWDIQHTIASVVIVANGVGALFYVLAMMASVIFPDSPFHTPISAILRRWLEGTRHSFRRSSAGGRAMVLHLLKSVRALPASLVGLITARWPCQGIQETFQSPLASWVRLRAVSAGVAISRGFHLFGLHIAHPFQRILGLMFPRRYPRPVFDFEHDLYTGNDTPISPPSVSMGRHLLCFARSTRDSTIKPIRELVARCVNIVLGVLRKLDRSPTSDNGDWLSATALVWMLETSTDPVVHTIAARAAPEVIWPGSADILHPLLDQLLDTFIACFQRSDERNEPDTVTVDQDRAIA